MKDIFEQLKASVVGIDIQGIVEKLTIFDWVLVVFIVVGIFYGLRKGMMRMICEVLEMGIVLFIVMSLYAKTAHYSMANIKGLLEPAAMPLAFIVILSLSWIFMMIVDGYLKKFIKTELFWAFKYSGGMILGGIGATLVFSFLVYGIHLMSINSFERILKPGASLVGDKVVKILPNAYSALSDPVLFLSPKRAG